MNEEQEPSWCIKKKIEGTNTECETCEYQYNGFCGRECEEDLQREFEED